MPNLVLIGFMGTGKTSVGRRLARRLGMKFVDTDQEIERITGMTVREIFKKYGEIRFRSEEKAAIRRITREDNQVIATGGGAVLDPENMDNLKKNGIVFCLTADADIIFDRVSRKKDRPLLQTENPLQTIKNLLAERQPFYAAADYTVDTSNRELDDIVREIAEIYSSGNNQGTGNDKDIKGEKID